MFSQEKIDVLSNELKSADYPHFIFATNKDTGTSYQQTYLQDKDIHDMLTILVHEVPDSIEIMKQVLNENNDVMGLGFKFHNN